MLEPGEDGPAADGRGARSKAVAAGPLGRAAEWVLVDGNRLLVAAGTSLAVFVVFVVAETFGLVAFVDGSPVAKYAGGLAAGVFSLTTIVVIVNQLILSREFATPAEALERFEGVLEFHHDVEDIGDVPVAPAEPTELMALLVREIDARGRILRERTGDHPDESVRERVLAYADEVVENAERLDRFLERADFGTFRALSAATTYDDPRQKYEARYLRNRYGDSLPPAARESLEEVFEILKLFGTAREYLKTIYMQRELTRLSQLTVVAGLVGVVAAGFLALLYGRPGDPTVPATVLPYIASALVAVTTFPACLLGAYILRTATVTRRTAVVGPVLTDSAPEERQFHHTGNDS